MTYNLSDTYIYDSQEIPRPPVVMGPFSEVPTMMLVGEIKYPDGHTVLVPQPVKFEASSVGLSFTGVMEAIERGPQSHAAGRTDARGVPVWAVALIVAGLALMAIGWLLNEPISTLIYTMIHGS